MSEIITAKSRAVIWRLNSPEYNKFCDLCRRKQWKTLPLADVVKRTITMTGVTTKKKKKRLIIVRKKELQQQQQLNGVEIIIR